MAHYNSKHESVSKVQLSPFSEDQWHRMVTYSSICVDLNDMLIRTQQRPSTSHVKNASKKLNLREPIDFHTLKLEDEILLNALHDLKTSTSSSGLCKIEEEATTDRSKFLHTDKDQRKVLIIEDLQTSSLEISQAIRDDSKYSSNQQSRPSSMHLRQDSRSPFSSHQVCTHSFIVNMFSTVSCNHDETYTNASMTHLGLCLFDLIQQCTCFKSNISIE
jgi:hypothetical protein